MPGIADLYGKNPHERNLGVLSNVADSTGYMKPVIMGLIGNEAGAAKEWDEEKATASMSSLKAANDQKMAGEMYDRILKVSEYDPKAAMMMAAIEGDRNPLLASIKGIVFNGRTKDGWALTTDADGETAYTDMFRLSEVSGPDYRGLTPEQVKEKMIENRIRVPWGGPKPAESRKRMDRKTHLGGDNWQDEESYDEGVKWNPVGKPYKKGGDGSGKARTLPDILDDIRATSSALGQIENEGLTNKILAASSSNPKIAEALRDSRGREDAKASMNRLLYILKDEYKNLSGKEYMGEAPMQAAAPAKGALNAQKNPDGSLTLPDGQRVVPDANGVVVIKGKKFKVN